MPTLPPALVQKQVALAYSTKGLFGVVHLFTNHLTTCDNLEHLVSLYTECACVVGTRGFSQEFRKEVEARYPEHLEEKFYDVVELGDIAVANRFCN